MVLYIYGIIDMIDFKKVKEAEAFVGITNNPNEAFYIMPDGKWLDGSGRYQCDPASAQYCSGQRNVDHGDITENYFGETLAWLDNANDLFDRMLMFMKETNAMRIDFKHGILNIVRTGDLSINDIKLMLKSFFKGNKARILNVEILAPNGKTIADKEFEFADYDTLLDWIRSNYFKTISAKRKLLAEIEKVDTVVLDIPLVLRLFELCRESIKDDVYLHTLTAALIKLRAKKQVLTMDDYRTILRLAKIDIR